MEKNKVGPNKTPCICTEDSVEDVTKASGTAPDFKKTSENLKKHLEKNQKCMCTYDGEVKNPNRVSWVDKDDQSPKCICQDINASGPVFDDISSTSVTPPEEPRKKKRSFVETLKYLVTCACCKKSEEAKPEEEPEPEEVDTKDSGIISLLGRTYSEAVYGKKRPIILAYDLPDYTPGQSKTKIVPQAIPGPSKTKIVPQDIPVQSKTKIVPQVAPVIQKAKDIPQVAPAKPKPKAVPQAAPAKPKPQVVPKVAPEKPKTKDVTPKVSFGKPLPKKKQSLACICTEDTLPKYGTRSSSRVSTRPSKVKCKCTDPEETASGRYISTKCVCGQLTPSEASLASGYTIGSRRSKPECCYPQKSEELIRKIDYQRPSQYSYSRYEEPLQTYGREAPSVRSLYTPSATSYTDSNQYLPEEDDISENLQLDDTGSTYSSRKSTSVIPSCCVSEPAAGPSKPTTLYQRLVKRFWLESILYKDPYQQPLRIQSAPSYLSDTASLHRPASTYRTASRVKQPTTKSMEKVCRCSRTELAAVPSKESKQKANVEKPKEEKPKPETSKAEKLKAEKLKAEKLKAEISELCICIKKSLSKKSNEDLVSPNVKECHCLELLYMSKSPSKGEEKVLSKTPSKAEVVVRKVVSKSPSNVSAGTSKDQPKSQNVPTIIVAPPVQKDTLRVPSAFNTNVSAGTSKDQPKSQNVPTIIVTPPVQKDTLQVPSVFDTSKETKPVDVKKSTEVQEQVASGSSAENPEEASPPLGNESSRWWDKSKHLIIGSTVVGATAIGAYQYFKE